MNTPQCQIASEFKLHQQCGTRCYFMGQLQKRRNCFKELRLVITSGSEKVRRVEVSRPGVIQGLGIQLLQQVYDLLEDITER